MFIFVYIVLTNIANKYTSIEASIILTKCQPLPVVEGLNEIAVDMNCSGYDYKWVVQFIIEKIHIIHEIAVSFDPILIGMP